ncbi:MAG: conjugative transposon protein TraM [Allomuricauda sp.]
MKIEKNKLVFTGVIICILLFIGGYGIAVMGKEESPAIDTNKIPIPELEDTQQVYNSKLEALDDLKEERETTAPSIYPEHMIDDKGYFNPDYMEYEKQRIIDSIYNQGNIDFESRTFRRPIEIIEELKPEIKEEPQTISEAIEKPKTNIKELGLEHQLFFASNPLDNPDLINTSTDYQVFVRVDGTQTVRNDYRLQMRLTKDAIIDGVSVPRNTPVYGFVSFKPNRAIIAISNINHKPVKLKAFDLLDGSEGIYIENSFRAEARQEVVGDIVDDINIAGVPQVNGIKKIFQRSNRKVKVTITDNYKLILKPIL